MALLAQNEGAPSLTKLPKLVKYVEAPYPAAALEENREGVVTLQIDVTATGTVAAVRVAASSGFEDFDRAALEAAQQFLFEPAEAGELGAVPVRITYRYGFVLKPVTKTATVAPAPPPGVAPKKPINFS